ncbi:gamma-glutamyl-gamma-aminobutyrate hydrolase family protein [Frondihabitans australicus]|uniref:Putative glutamine amidotransferase n=1 Tax=Frondihabitans australicus TaxID=386892 RepID=A0A495IL25_9MICO|nr:gamma-glutamyl-gamma-aminobutyrate hydrolase family protein [Frondihabitans australicus]RKR75981.1 putative glutamine amidotransferase [Frondihabitans australicus]
MTADRPRLLIVDVSDRDRDDPLYGKSLRELSASVADAAARAGFAVQRVASDGPSLVAELDRADAVVLTGGEDVDPALYGGAESYPHRGQIFADADRAQVALVRECVTDAVPLIGICRGMQVINVALGGDLVQHLEGGGHVSDGPADGPMLAHTVDVEDDSDLARIVGSTTLTVQSSHHQAVGRPGRGLRIVARADDGTIEAVEHESAPLWAVQWHPEDAGSTGTVLADMLDAARARVVPRPATP